MGHHREWKDLSAGRKVGIVVVSAAQVALAGAAFRDLARRPAEQVDGPKLAWGLALLVNWIGPIAYFTKGRLPQA
ncbi:PLDc N-terminal domain-containing protein [Cellulomonas soli]|uniref:Cardiolipin synthase N-terminal domain-containing protein n=1 Tax=Cellulomonas soli TaxID=931535 RepID=A0A512PE47_9CELL|nr:PLDc N-terminal domain-containing protein [Cellulomonas soli]NYI59087.1 hypothetical protein [Cellulomonas soli]GEP69422.1 hypothetical protein CSO01_21370 [Cellulomonas soli]